MAFFYRKFNCSLSTTKNKSIKFYANHGYKNEQGKSLIVFDKKQEPETKSTKENFHYIEVNSVFYIDKNISENNNYKPKIDLSEESNLEVNMGNVANNLQQNENLDTPVLGYLEGKEDLDV